MGIRNVPIILESLELIKILNKLKYLQLTDAQNTFNRIRISFTVQKIFSSAQGNNRLRQRIIIV